MGVIKSGSSLAPAAAYYPAQAEAGLRRYAARLAPNRYGHDAERMLLIADWIRDAIHFALPDDGALLEDGLRGVAHESLRLPFAAITAAYHATRWTDDDRARAPRMTYPPRRVVVARECTDDFAIEFFHLDEREVRAAWDGARSGIITAAAMCDTNDVWYPDIYGCLLEAQPVVPRCDIDPDLVAVDPADRPHPTKHSPVILLVPCLWLPGSAARFGLNGPVTAACCHQDAAGEAGAVLGLLEALSCSNVGAESVGGASPVVNAKRVRKGKLPLYESRILVLTTPSGAAVGPSLGGHHRSPRQHLRRGHVRRLDPDRKVWVNACVVGRAEDGVIEKQYAVESA